MVETLKSVHKCRYANFGRQMYNFDFMTSLPRIKNTPSKYVYKKKTIKINVFVLIRCRMALKLVKIRSKHQVSNINVGLVL